MTMEKRLYSALQRAKQKDEEGLKEVIQQFEKKIEAELRQTSSKIGMIYVRS